MRCSLAIAAALAVFTPVAAVAQTSLIGKLEGVEVLTDFMPESFSEAPELAEQVAAGELPPVEERIGSDPLVIRPIHEVGQYGGTWRRGFLGPTDDANAGRAVLHDRLLYWNYDETEIVPNIAKDYEISEDGRETTIHLREGARWSDGEPLTADDFVFWYQHIATNKDLSPNLSPDLLVADEPVRLEKIDDYTVKFISVNPYYTLPIKLASNSTLAGHAYYGETAGGSFAPAHYLKQFHPDFAGQDVVDEMAREAGYDSWEAYFLGKNTSWRNPELPTMAAWRLVTPITETVWEYERNPYSIWVDEAGNQLPYIDRVAFTVAEDLEVLNLRAMAGDYDSMARHIDLTKLPALLENQEQGDYTVHLDTSSNGGEAYVCVNMSYDADPAKADLLQNVDFRRALSLGIDRDAINEVLFLGLGTPGSLLPAEGAIYNPDGPDDKWRNLWSTYDPEAANELLDGIGLTEKDSDGYRMRPDGDGHITLELMTFLSFMDYTTLGEMIREDYKDIGIDLNVRQMERSATQVRRRNNDHELTIDTAWGSSNLLGHPTELWPLDSLSCAGPQFGRWFASQGAEGVEPPEVMQKINQLYQDATQVPPEEGTEYMQQIWEIVLDQQWAIGTVGLSPAIQGVRVVSNDMGNIPARQLNNAITENPGNSRPEQWYFKQ